MPLLAFRSTRVVRAPVHRLALLECARHGPRPELRAAGLRRPQGVPSCQWQDHHLPARPQCQAHADLRGGSVHPPVPEELFIESVRLAVAANAEFVPPHESGAAMYIRPLIFGSSAQLGLSPPDGYTLAVFVMPTGVYHGAHAVDALILEDFDRCAPHGTGAAKVGGNYAPVLRHSDRARREGFGITLHLDSATRSEIDEFSTSAFLGVVRDGDSVTIVQPNSQNVIDSVTASSVLEIAQGLGYRVEKRRVAYEELSRFDEVIAGGTAAALVPVKSITRRSTGDKFEYRCGDDSQGGPIAATLLKMLRGIQSGAIEDARGWNYEVHAPPTGWMEGANGHETKERSGTNVP